MSFRFHDELLRGMNSFEKCKITVQKMERTRTRNQRPWSSEQISPVITGASNSFLSGFIKGHCPDINVVKCRLKYFLFT